MIGIIGATTEEANAIMAVIENKVEEKLYDVTFVKGTLNGKEVVFVQSGIGKVNATIVATLLINKYDVEKIIFSGVAGSVDESLKIGDVVVGTEVIQHDVDATKFGYKKGQIPQMAVYGFECDENMRNVLKDIKFNNFNMKFGKILTGDQFIDGKEIKIKLGVDFKALCVDMESGAVAQTCYRLNKKFLIIRSISDSISDDSEMEYSTFVNIAANNAVEILKKLI